VKFRFFFWGGMGCGAEEMEIREEEEGGRTLG